jgi:hypothetical protein
MAGIFRQRHPEHTVFYRVFFYYFFTHEIFSLLLRQKLIGLPLVQNLLHWRHTGFNVHSKFRAKTKSKAERVGKYMIRPPPHPVQQELLMAAEESGEYF